jgi:hypothetical protein
MMGAPDIDASEFAWGITCPLAQTDVHKRPMPSNSLIWSFKEFQNEVTAHSPFCPNNICVNENAFV